MCRRADPKGLLFGTDPIAINPDEAKREKLKPVLDRTIKGKRFLSCSGGADRLVPYHMAEPFINFLQGASRGWYKDGNVVMDDRVYAGVGHEFSDDMIRDSVEFLVRALEEEGKNSEEKARI